MKKILILSLLLFCFGPLSAQNGRIISSQEVSYPDSITKSLTARLPRFQKVFDSTQTLDITYLSEGLKIKGYVMQPKLKGKYPCLIYCRGGTEDYGMTDLYFAAVLSDIANHGYVVITSQLRGSEGSEGKDEIGGADTADVINCIPALAGLAQADTSRIGMYGISRGGLNALQVLRSQKNIRAAVINSGVVNAFDGLKRKDGEDMEKNNERLIPHYQTEKQHQLLLRSPIFWPEKICRSTALLILQGSSDWRVDAGSTIQFVQKLYALKQPMRFVLVEGGTHGLRVPLRDSMLIEWLDRYVKNKAPLPDMELHGD